MERICRIRQLPDGHNFTLSVAIFLNSRPIHLSITLRFVDEKQHARQLYLHPEGD